MARGRPARTPERPPRDVSLMPALLESSRLPFSSHRPGPITNPRHSDRAPCAAPRPATPPPPLAPFQGRPTPGQCIAASLWAPWQRNALDIAPKGPWVLAATPPPPACWPAVPPHACEIPQPPAPACQAGPAATRCRPPSPARRLPAAVTSQLLPAARPSAAPGWRSGGPACLKDARPA